MTSRNEAELQAKAKKYMEEYYSQDFFKEWTQEMKDNARFLVQTAMIYALRRDKEEK